MVDLNFVLTLEESFLLMEIFKESKHLQPAFMNISLHVFKKWILFHVVETLISGLENTETIMNMFQLMLMMPSSHRIKGNLGLDAVTNDESRVH